MKTFEVSLKITNPKQGIHHTFKWMQEDYRIKDDFTTLLLDAENDIEVYEKVEVLGEGTLKVLNIKLATTTEAEAIRELIELASPINNSDMMSLLLSNGLTVGNN